MKQRIDPAEGEVELSGNSRAGKREALTDLVMRTFRLNGLFLSMGDLMAKPAGLTSARWQVLGAVLRKPLTVSEVARDMGLTRQSVQRLANALVDNGMAEFIANPEHARAKLLRPTAEGRRAIDVIRPLQHSFAEDVTSEFEERELRQVVEIMDRLTARLEEEPWVPPGFE